MFIQRRTVITFTNNINLIIFDLFNYLSLDLIKILREKNIQYTLFLILWINKEYFFFEYYSWLLDRFSHIATFRLFVTLNIEVLLWKGIGMYFENDSFSIRSQSHRVTLFLNECWEKCCINLFRLWFDESFSFSKYNLLLKFN